MNELITLEDIKLKMLADFPEEKALQDSPCLPLIAGVSTPCDKIIPFCGVFLIHEGNRCRYLVEELDSGNSYKDVTLAYNEYNVGYQNGKMMVIKKDGQKAVRILKS